MQPTQAHLTEPRLSLGLRRWGATEGERLRVRTADTQAVPTYGLRNGPMTKHAHLASAPPEHNQGAIYRRLPLAVVHGLCRCSVLPTRACIPRFVHRP